VKEKYISFSTKRSDLPVFFQPWWLDAVVGAHSWDVALIEEGSSIKACFLYVLKKKGPFTAIGMPGLTPYLGFWVDPGIDPETIQDKILSILPRHDKFYMQLHYNAPKFQLNQLNYREEVLYTYVLSGIKDHKKLYSNFKSNLRGTIRKATGEISVVESRDVEKLYELCQMSYTRQAKDANFSIDLVKSIFEAVSNRNCGTILMAEDKKGNMHAATLLVWDEKCAYYLLNGGDPNLRASGANSLLMWETIKYASQHTNTFDFEGSMVPGVEVFIQGFKPDKREYPLFTKTNSKIVGIAESIKGVIKGKG